jgi:hypothetical protein
MNKHIIFFSDRCIHCSNLLTTIKKKCIEDKFKYINVGDPNIKIPDIITSVPTLIVQGINKLLIGKEVFTWLNSQQFMNIETNNINKTNNPKFNADKTLTNSTDINYVSLNDEDDSNKIINFNKMSDIFITDDINQKIKDSKINQQLQNEKLNELLNNRTVQIENILSNNKKF